MPHALSLQIDTPGTVGRLHKVCRLGKNSWQKVNSTQIMTVRTQKANSTPDTLHHRRDGHTRMQHNPKTSQQSLTAARQCWCWLNDCKMARAVVPLFIPPWLLTNLTNIPTTRWDWSSPTTEHPITYVNKSGLFLLPILPGSLLSISTVLQPLHSFPHLSAVSITTVGR